jgi:hypothetical protein
LVATKGDDFALEEVGSTFIGSIIDEVVATIEVLMMREDETLMSYITEVFLHPIELVACGSRIAPR